MPDSSLIDAYLGTLRQDLRVNPRRRERILQEAEEHLRDGAIQAELDGLTPEEAQHAVITRFGSSQLIARQFAAAYATDQACGASTVSVAVIGVVLVVLQGQDQLLTASSTRLYLHAPPPLSVGLVGFTLALGLLFVALAIGCVALWQTRVVRRQPTTLAWSAVQRILGTSVCSLIILFLSSLADMVFLGYRAALTHGGPPAAAFIVPAVLQVIAIGIGGLLVARAVARFGTLGLYHSA